MICLRMWMGFAGQTRGLYLAFTYPISYSRPNFTNAQYYSTNKVEPHTPSYNNKTVDDMFNMVQNLILCKQNRHSFTPVRDRPVFLVSTLGRTHSRSELITYELANGLLTSDIISCVEINIISSLI